MSRWIFSFLKQQSLAGRVNPYPFPNDQKGIPQGFGIFRLFHGFAALGHYSSAEKMAVRIFTSEHNEQNARPRRRARKFPPLAKITAAPVSSDTTPPRPSCSASTASAESLSSCFAVMARSPAPLRSTTAAHYARQAAGRPLPALAGQRSAFLPTARRAPFSDNAWK